MKLSIHFDLSEFTHSQTAIRRGIDNTPDDTILTNLYRLAQTLEQVREVLGKPIIISSGYRCPELNAAIGGSKTSAHMKGLACDFTCPAFGTPYAVALEIADSVVEFDQIIYEGTWVHLGLSDNPRRQLLTARFPNGKAVYEMGINA